MNPSIGNFWITSCTEHPKTLPHLEGLIISYPPKMDKIHTIIRNIKLFNGIGYMRTD